MGPILWNALAFIQRHFRVYCKLASPALMSWIQQSLYLYCSVDAFPLMEVFLRILYKEVLRMSAVPWNFAYAKHASYSLPAIATAQSDPTMFLKIQQHSLPWPVDWEHCCHIQNGEPHSSPTGPACALSMILRWFIRLLKSEHLWMRPRLDVEHAVRVQNPSVNYRREVARQCQREKWDYQQLQTTHRKI